ncbi:helix-turn-helix domain-containing protein [Dysgonomonas termitidis]|uniref:Helix-turn-helix domain-containing protein n=1 Tax=Dysgonomonas termitidis TaxID=1516126 RepID=A0ABV9L157_9BACT
MGQDFKEYIELIIKLLTKRFDSIDNKLDRLSRIKDVMEGDELLDNQDVCLLLGITPRTLQRYKQFGLLPYEKIKGKSYYKKSDVMNALKRK